ncbi:TetR/AcrR family transcriptional regulator [Rhodococcus sp. SJ-3]|uniref:TetR/AcrR family transcriptional regulator n=1 Tax=Rhodococcus sp. SJ-3 TaxID=3454628 RepID=UPI003F7A528F
MRTQPPGHIAILDAARAEFSERGYAAATIRTIAQRAGLSLSAMYYYYKSKQELLVALLNDGLDAYVDACAHALDTAGDDPGEQLEALIEATVRFRATHPTKSSIGMTERRNLDPEHQRLYREHEIQATDRFRRIIDRGVQEGLFLTPYPDDARRTIIATCNAIAEWYRPDGQVAMNDLVERYVSLAFTIVEYRPRRTRSAGNRGRSCNDRNGYGVAEG